MRTWLSAALVWALASAGAAQAAPPGSRWSADYFGNAELVTHDRQKVKLYDDLLRGKIVVVDFIFTRCTKQCGLVTASLARVQRLLGDRMGKDLFFYSISIDPERDTPEVLADYARAFRAGPGWTFLTGQKQDIAEIRKKFGDLSPVEGHPANLYIGNEATGQWMAKGAVDSPRHLATVIGDWMDPAWGTRAAQPGTAPAVAGALAATVDGKTLFAVKCAVCHEANGSGDGPSLAGVTARRDRAWLLEWVRAPAKLLASGDATARELVARFNGVEMPSLDLTAEDAEAVVGYLGEPSPATPPSSEASRGGSAGK